MYSAECKLSREGNSIKFFFTFLSSTSTYVADCHLATSEIRHEMLYTEMNSNVLLFGLLQALILPYLCKSQFFSAMICLKRFVLLG